MATSRHDLDATVIAAARVFTALLMLIGGLPEAARADEMLILCPASFREPLEELRHQKERTGVSVEIQTLEWIEDVYEDPAGDRFVDEADRIKYAIYSYYQTHGLFYVLLVGDAMVTVSNADSTHTDPEGAFVFSNVPAGTYAVSASLPPRFGAAATSVEVDGE